MKALLLLLLLTGCGADEQDGNSVPCYDVSGDRNKDGKLTEEDCKELNRPMPPTTPSQSPQPQSGTDQEGDSGDEQESSK